VDYGGGWHCCNGQCSAGLRRRTREDDSACNELQRVFSAWLESPDAVQCRKTAQASSLSTGLRVATSREGQQRSEFGLRRRFGVGSELWVWGISAHLLGGIFETIPEHELCGGRGEAPACWELLGLGAFTPLGSSASLQWHYGDRSYMVVAFSVW
jgi:hypothetical protein